VELMLILSYRFSYNIFGVRDNTPPPEQKYSGGLVMRLNWIHHNFTIREFIEIDPEILKQILNIVNMYGIPSGDQGKKALYQAQDAIVNKVATQYNLKPNDPKVLEIIDNNLVMRGEDEWFNKATIDKPEQLDSVVTAPSHLSTGVPQPPPLPPPPPDEEILDEIDQQGGDEGDVPLDRSQWRELWLGLYRDAIEDDNIIHHRVVDYFGRGANMAEIFPYQSRYYVFEYDGYIVIATYLSGGATGVYILRDPVHKDIREFGIRKGTPVQDWAEQIATAIVQGHGEELETGEGGDRRRYKLDFRNAARRHGLCMFTRRDKFDDKTYHDNLQVTMQGLADNYLELAEYWGEEHLRLAESIIRLIEMVCKLRRVIL